MGEKPRRRWRLDVQIEGDTWEDAGRAFGRVLELLQKGNPEELHPERPFTVTMDLCTGALKIEITQDPRMTPLAYKEVRDAYEHAARDTEPPPATD